MPDFCEYNAFKADACEHHEAMSDSKRRVSVLVISVSQSSKQAKKSKERTLTTRPSLMAMLLGFKSYSQSQQKGTTLRITSVITLEVISKPAISMNHHSGPKL